PSLDRRRRGHGALHVPLTGKADIQLGDAMTETVTRAGTPYQEATRNNVWMHMSPHQALFNGGEAPVIVRGQGHHIFDDKGRKYADGLAGLCTVQVGPGREALATALYAQRPSLPTAPLWSYPHP